MLKPNYATGFKSPNRDSHKGSPVLTGREPRHNEKRGNRQPAAPEFTPALASTLQRKNFTMLVESAGEENIALGLDVPLKRVRELLKGYNFSDETSYHIETTLKLKSGFLDQVNPQLSDEDIVRLKNPFALDTEEHAEEPTPPPAAKPHVTVAPPSEPTKASVTPTLHLKKSAASAENSAPVRTGGRPRKETLPSAGETVEDEHALREIRKNNLMVLTTQPGSKSQLGRLVGMSPANISHRLHGVKNFDAATATFIAEKIGLPPDWFNTPHTESDIPPEVISLLAKKTKGAPPARKAENAELAHKAPASSQHPARPVPSAASGTVFLPGATITAVTEPVATVNLNESAQFENVTSPASEERVSVRSAPATPGIEQQMASGAGTTEGLPPLVEALVKTICLQTKSGQFDERKALKWLNDLMG